MSKRTDQLIADAESYLAQFQNNQSLGLSGPESEAPTEDEDQQGYFADSVDAFQHGMLSGVADIADGVRYLADSDTAGNVADYFRGYADQQLDQMSDEGREAMQNFGIETEGGVGFKDGSTAGGFGLNVISGLGSFAPSMIPAGLFAKGLGTAGKVLGGAGKAGKASKAIDKAADVAAFGGAGAVSIGGSTGNQAYDTVANADFNILKDSEYFKARYWDLRDNEEMDHELALNTARESIAREVAERAAKDGAFLGAISQGALGPVFGRLFRGEAGGYAKAIATGAATEGAQEFIESGGQTLATNTNVDSALPREAGEGVLDDALTGMVTGGAVGGAFGAGGKLLNRNKADQNTPEKSQQTEEERQADAIQDEIDQINDLLNSDDLDLSDEEFEELLARREELLRQQGGFADDQEQKALIGLPDPLSASPIQMPNENVLRARERTRQAFEGQYGEPRNTGREGEYIPNEELETNYSWENRLARIGEMLDGELLRDPQQIEQEEQQAEQPEQQGRLNGPSGLGLTAPSYLQPEPERNQPNEDAISYSQINGEDAFLDAPSLRPEQRQQQEGRQRRTKRQTEFGTPQQSVIAEPYQPTETELAAREATRRSFEEPVTAARQSRKARDEAYQLRKQQEQQLEQERQRQARLREEQRQKENSVKLGQLEFNDEIKAAKGAKAQTYTPSNEPLEVEYRVVEVDDLTTSHDDDFRERSDYPQALQNRDRSSEGLVQQVKDYANKLNPAKLGEDSGVDGGAPIVRGSVVESGNGRTMSIRRAYNQGKAGGYRKFLEENADRFGINKEELNQFERPVLVRQRLTDMTPEELTKYTKDANTPESFALSPVEQAKSDANRLTDSDLLLIDIPESGDFAAASNRAFVRRFMDHFPKQERRGMETGKNQAISDVGINRIQNAIFAKAYQSDQLIEDVTSTSADDIKTVAKALLNAAPEVAKLNAQGGIDGFTNTITEAVSIIKKSRRENISVSELTNQFDLMAENTVSQATANLANFIDNNARSVRKLSDALKGVAVRAQESLRNSQVDGLFGRAPEPTLDELFTFDDVSNQTNSDVKVLPSGKPYSSRKVARLSRTYSQTENPEIVEVNGGFGIVEGQATNTEAEQSAQADSQTEEAEPAVNDTIEFNGSNYERTTHTTKKGKELTGIIWEGVDRNTAKEVDPFTFKKDGGWFIREARVQEYQESQAEDNAQAEQIEPTTQERSAQEQQSQEQEGEIVSFANARTVRDKVNLWKNIKQGDVIYNHNGVELGPVVVAPTKGKPRGIKVRDGERLASHNAASVTGEGSYIIPLIDKAFSEPEQGSTETRETPKQKPKASENKIFTEDAAEEARKLLLRKMGQLNSGVDPEVLQAGITLAGYHIEKGARTFAAYAKAMVDDLGEVAKPYLKSWYMGVKYDPRAAGFGGMDDAATVDSADIESILREPESQTAEQEAPAFELGSIDRELDFDQEPEQPTQANPLFDVLYDQLGEIKDNRKLKSVLADNQGLKVSDITDAQLKEAQETLESVLVERAREIVGKGNDDKATFDELLELYQNQPNLNVRSSTSMENQAYSTPAPIAFLASRLAGINNSSIIYEPTAGNGMLAIGASKDNAILNELNDFRADQLEAQGFSVTRNDATNFVPSQKVDAVITNPPFGSIPKTTYDGYTIRAIDHLIVAKSLEALKDDGKATLIIGANKSAGEIKSTDRTFFNWLYSNFNVTDHFEIDGKLYNRQGAGWPIRVITIDGRQESDTLSPRSGSIERVNTWEQVYDRYVESLEAANSNITAAESTDDVGQRTANDNGPSATTTQSPANQTDSQGRRGGNANSGGASRFGRTSTERASTESSRSNRESGQRESDVNDGRGSEETGQTRLNGPSNNQANDARRMGGERSNSDSNVDASDYQVEYTTLSNGSNEAVLTPSNMADASRRTLERLNSDVAGIDEYVRERLNYDTIDDVHEAFMGLQADTVAAAIYNAETKNKGIIIADQTGVGKGRQAAGIIRYALNSGRIPVFVTVKENLFTDMYNDLKDIGSDDVSPLILNQDGGITENGKRIFTNPSRAQHKSILNEIARTGELPEGKNAVFLTYSQINTANIQRSVISAIKDRAYFVLDESHNAAGERERFSKDKGKTVTGAGFIYSAIHNRPVTYLSATYAKRPDNMPVYYRTDIEDAVDNIDELVDAVSLGGEQLQTIMAGMLAESGQLFRRERSFKGIEVATQIDTNNTQAHTVISDKITKGLRSIVDADRLFHTIAVDALDKAIQEAGGNARGAGNKASQSVDHTNFTSIVHNFISQLLLGLKVDTTISTAVDSFKRGEKPVIALQNTMGSFLKGYIEENNLSVGDRIEATYKDVLMKALDRTRRVTIRDKRGEDQVVEVPLNDLDPLTRGAYIEAQQVIESLDIDDMPLSPIDYVRDGLEKNGMRVAEITGRDFIIDYSKGYPVVAKRDTSEITNRRGVVDRFNEGELDSLILNSAGSTGLSIHSSEKFKDQSPRHMIIMQAMGDINIFMQMLGRINRTGQVNLPRYTMLGLNIPAEKRPLAKTSRKMKSLNANTSANTESDTSIDAPDILNKYGDQIVANYLKENRDVAVDVGLSSEAQPNGLAERFTGRLALLPVKRQLEIYEEIEAQYNDHIDYLNKVNQNDLVPTTLDLDAKIEESTVIYEGKAPDTVFGGNTYLHKVDAKYQGKPPTGKDVADALNKAPDPDENASNIRAGKEAERYIERFDESRERSFAEYQDTLNAELTADGLSVDTAKAAMDVAESRSNKELYRKYDKLNTQLEDIQSRYSDVKRVELLDMRKTNLDMLERFKIGNRVRLDLDGETVTAAIVNVRDSHKSGKGNPWALSKTKVSFMVNSGIRQIELPFSKLGIKDGVFIESLRGKGLHGLDELFDMSSLIENRRETRFIATGNLIKGSSELSQGRIVSFTDQHGNEYKGILMPRNFKQAEYDRLKKATPFIIRESEKVAQMLKDNPRVTVFNSDQSIRVERSGIGEWSIIVPRSNKTNEVKSVKFDRELREIIGSDFFGRTKEMKATVSEKDLEPAITRLLDLVPLHTMPHNRDAWVRAGGRAQPKADNVFASVGVQQPSQQEAISANDIRKAVKPLADELNENGFFEVVQSVDDLPLAVRVQVRNRLKKSKAENPRIRGVNVGGKSYLIADGFNSSQEAIEVFLHEVVGHKAVLDMLGKDGDDIMESIAMSYGREGLADLIKLYGVEPTTKKNRILLGKEKVAQMAERGEKPSLIKRLVAKVRGWLRKYFPQLRWSDNDVLNLIADARVRAGNTQIKSVESNSEPLLSIKGNENPSDIQDIISRTQSKPEHQKTLVERATDFANKIKEFDLLAMKQGIIDSYASIENLEKKVNLGKLMDGAESAYKAALRTANLDSVVEVAMRRGALEYKDGAFQIKDGTKGLLEIFEKIADSDQLQLWETWAGARRAKRIMEEDAKANLEGQAAMREQRAIIARLKRQAPSKYAGGLRQWRKDLKAAEKALKEAKAKALQKRERLYKPSDIERVMRYVNSKPELKKEFERAHREWRKFNKATLDMAEQAGLIDPEARAIWEHDDYVPFHRVAEVEGENSINPFARKRGLSGQKSNIKQLKGGVEKLNILESMVRNTTHLIDASFKNVAMQRIVEMADGVAMEKMPPSKMDKEEVDAWLEELGYTPENMDEDIYKAWAKQLERYNKLDKGTVSVSQNGKLVRYHVTDPLLYHSITQLGPVKQDALMKILQIPKRALTTMVTAAPGFMAANFVRDTLSTWVTVEPKTTPVYDAIKGAVKAARRDESQWAMMAAGAGGGGYYDTSPENVRQHLSTLDKGGALHRPKQLWDAWMRFGQAAENANRIAVYDSVIKNGGTVAEAAHQAQDVINFSKRGGWRAMQYLISAVPFMNARIQGLDRLWRGFKDDRKGFALKGGAITLASLAILASNLDNEEYWELEEWDRDANWHIFFGDTHIKLPKPFEVGAFFGTIPERAIEQLWRSDANGKLLAERMLSMALDTFAIDPTPQLVKPAIEVARNKNGFTGNPILGFGDQFKSPERQFSPWTSETMKLMAEAMPEFAPEWMRSPKRLEYLLKGYFGTFGGYILNLADTASRWATNAPEQPESTIGKVPVVKRFYSDELTGNKHISRFYDMTDEVNKLYDKVKSLHEDGLRKEAQNELKSNMDKLRLRNHLNKVRQQMSEISAQIRLIYMDRNMSSTEKRRRIDELTKRRNQIARTASLRFYDVF